MLSLWTKGKHLGRTKHMSHTNHMGRRMARIACAMPRFNSLKRTTRTRPNVNQLSQFNQHTRLQNCIHNPQQVLQHKMQTSLLQTLSQPLFAIPVTSDHLDLLETLDTYGRSSPSTTLTLAAPYTTSNPYPSRTNCPTPNHPRIPNPMPTTGPTGLMPTTGPMTGLMLRGTMEAMVLVNERAYCRYSRYRRYSRYNRHMPMGTNGNRNFCSSSPKQSKDPDRNDRNNRNNYPNDNQPDKKKLSWFGAGNGSGRNPLGGIGATGLLGLGALLIGKGKYLFAALKLTKLSSVLSMGVSIGAYSMLYGWPYACGLVGLIYVHEMGHVFAMRQRNIKVGPMVFLPFIGAGVVMESNPRTAFDSAYVAIAGPVAGTLGALVPLTVALTTGSNLAFALANVGFLLNLFNLMPIGFLDGGRIAPVIHRNLIYMGLAAGCLYVLTFKQYHPMSILILLGGFWSAYQNYTGAYANMYPDLNTMPKSHRQAIALGYFGLIVILITLLMFTQANTKSASQLRLEQKTVHLTIGTDGQIVFFDPPKALVDPASFEKNPDWFRVIDDGGTTFSVQYGAGLKGPSMLPPGSEINFKKPGQIQLTLPESSRDQVGMGQITDAVANAMGLPNHLLIEDLNDLGSSSSDEYNFKVDIKGLKSENERAHYFWNTYIFNVNGFKLRLKDHQASQNSDQSQGK